MRRLTPQQVRLISTADHQIGQHDPEHPCRVPLNRADRVMIALTQQRPCADEERFDLVHLNPTFGRETKKPVAPAAGLPDASVVNRPVGRFPARQIVFAQHRAPLAVDLDFSPVRGLPNGAIVNPGTVLRRTAVAYFLRGPVLIFAVPEFVVVLGKGRAAQDERGNKPPHHGTLLLQVGEPTSVIAAAAFWSARFVPLPSSMAQ